MAVWSAFLGMWVRSWTITLKRLFFCCFCEIKDSRSHNERKFPSKANSFKILLYVICESKKIFWDAFKIVSLKKIYFLQMSLRNGLCMLSSFMTSERALCVILFTFKFQNRPGKHERFKTFFKNSFKINLIILYILIQTNL